MNRQYWHNKLDEAMDETKEGESFIGRFIDLVIYDIYRSKNTERGLAVKEYFCHYCKSVKVANPNQKCNICREYL